MIPAARIALDGIDITANLIPAPFGIPLAGGGVSIPNGFGTGGPLISLSVTDNEGGQSDSVDLEIDNRDQFPGPRKGAMMMVSMGWLDAEGMLMSGGLQYMGRYSVDQWTKRGRPRQLSVSAKAAELTTDTKAPKSRSYHEMTVDEIVSKVAGKHGFSAKVHPQISDLKIGHIDQSNESDLNFMTRLAHRVGAKFKPADGKFIFHLPGSGESPTGGQTAVFPISETGVIDWSATGAERGTYGSVAVAWQDTKKGERTWIDVGSGDGPKYRDRKLYKTEAEARAAAQGQLSGLKRGRITADVTLIGNPMIFAGAKVLLSDFDPDVDGEYTVKTATHTLDNSGYKTTLNLETTGEKGGAGEDVEKGGAGD